ncbi:hypothetical protein D3C71_2174440 [compost metagenome]
MMTAEQEGTTINLRQLPLLCPLFVHLIHKLTHPSMFADILANLIPAFLGMLDERPGQLTQCR